MLCPKARRYGRNLATALRIAGAFSAIAIPDARENRSSSGTRLEAEPPNPMAPPGCGFTRAARG